MIKKTPLLVVILIVYAASFNAQGKEHVNRVFESTTGAPAFNPILTPLGIHYSHSIVDASSNLITVGHSSVTGQGENILLTKYNSTGAISFQVDWNSGTTYNDYGTNLYEANNGDIIVCGTTDNGGITDFDVVILRYSSTGTLLFSTIKAGPDGKNDIATAVIQDASNNIIISAASENTSTLVTLYKK